jgi:hypothetical protein
MRYSIYILSLLLVLFSCKSKPYQLPYHYATGYVIDQEFCYADSGENAWLISLSNFSGQENLGDSVNIHGDIFPHAVRTFNLPDTFRHVGIMIGVGFNIAETPSLLQDCTADSPEPFSLKDIDIINCSFLR